MTHLLNPDLLNHIATQLCLPLDKVKDVLDSFVPCTTQIIPKQVIPARSHNDNSSIPTTKLKEQEPTTPITQTNGTKPPTEVQAPKLTLKPIKTTTPKTQKQTCDRVPKGKTDPCGKGAKRFINIDGKEMWYCGTENSGCFKTMLAESKKLDELKTLKQPKIKMTKPVDTTNLKSKVLENINANKPPLHFNKIKTSDDKLIWVNKDPREIGTRKVRFVSNIDTKQIYGTYSASEGISELNDEDCAYLERCGHAFVRKSDKKDSVSSDEDSKSCSTVSSGSDTGSSKSDSSENESE